MIEIQQILIYDTHLVDQPLIDYFKQFNIQFAQKTTLQSVQDHHTQPIAILIHWSLLKNNLAAIKNLYQDKPLPIIVIQDEDIEDHAIQALEAGADDVLSKPINPRELHARISAINRRVLRSKPSRGTDKEIILFADWQLHPTSRQVFDKKNNKELKLSAGEYDLLYAFVKEPQIILSREHLVEITKQSNLSPVDRRIDVQISRLRQKLEPHGKTSIIKTIRNSGYLFVPEVRHLKE